MDPIIETFWNLVNNLDTDTKIWAWVAGTVILFVLVVIGDYISMTRKQKEKTKADFRNLVPVQPKDQPKEDPPAKTSKMEPERLTRKMFLKGTLLHRGPFDDILSETTGN